MRINISHQLILGIITSSVIITCFVTLLGSIQIYNHERDLLNEKIKELLQVDAIALTDSIWVIDKDKMQEILKQIYSYKKVDYIELSFHDKTQKIVLGQKPEESIEFSYNLQHSNFDLAILKVFSDHKQLTKAVKLSVMNNIGKFISLVLFTSVFLYFLIHYLLTRHLLRISSFLESINFENQRKLKLKRSDKQIIKEDELSRIVDSINSLVQKSYINKENLEKKVFERTRELEQALAQVKKSNEIKTHFLANMSHEIRTPLNGVIGITDILIEKIHDNSLQTYLNHLSHSNKHLLKIVNDILDISKIESGKITLEAAKIKFPRFIEEVLGISKIRAHKKKIQFNHNIDDNLPKLIIGDSTRIKQILTNVIDNAIKFTDKGTVDFKCHAKVNENKANITLVVSDTGKGFDERSKNKLFNIFTQEDDSTTRRFGGTGLGLSICKGILDLMGGSIDLENNPKGGAKCTIKFSAPIQTKNEDEVKNLKKIFYKNHKVQDHILVVEDNEINLELMKGLLEGLALNVTFAKNGKEAVERCKNLFFPLILMDCHMPIMDGYEASLQIKNLFNGQLKPYIVAVTASAMESDRLKCQQAGMDQILSKPIKSRVLYELFDQLIDRKIINCAKKAS